MEELGGTRPITTAFHRLKRTSKVEERKLWGRIQRHRRGQKEGKCMRLAMTYEKGGDSKK